MTREPLERAEIDHTNLDLFAIDDETLLPLGRPWFSACEDDYTRCILGMFVGFIPPSFLTVSLCLKDVFRPKDAHEAARFYAVTFPDSKVTAVHEAPGDYPGGKKGDVLTVEFTVLGIPCLGLNGGPAFRHTEAFSFQIATENQEETDRYWNAIVGNGGTESQCGWCKDRWGLSWQITPRALTDALAAGGGEAKRAFEAMMTMKKIDIAAIEAARRG